MPDVTFTHPVGGGVLDWHFEPPRTRTLLRPYGSRLRRVPVAGIAIATGRATVPQRNGRIRKRGLPFVLFAFGAEEPVTSTSSRVRLLNLADSYRGRNLNIHDILLGQVCMGSAGDGCSSRDEAVEAFWMSGLALRHPSNEMVPEGEPLTVGAVFDRCDITRLDSHWCF